MTSSGSRAPRADGRRDRWRAHREARREELIATVVAAVNELGAGVSIDEISAWSGTAKPVFYRYFENRADLFLAVGRRVAASVVAETTAAIDRERSPRAMLSAGIDAYLAHIESNPELYRFVVLHDDSGQSSGGRDVLDDYASIVGLHASRIIGEFMRQAGQDAGAAELWGFGIVGMVRSAADRWLEQRMLSREAVVACLTDLIWPGLSSAAPALAE
jgi:AcrR family transcriptional regulator